MVRLFMGIVKLFIAVLVGNAIFLSPLSFANSSACLLLKQQMSKYEKSKNHPIYRRSKRDYDRICSQPEQPQFATNRKNTPTNNTQNQRTEQPKINESFTETAELTKPASITSQTEDVSANAQIIKSVEQPSSVKTPINAQAQKLSKPIPMQWQSQHVASISLLEAMRMPLLMTLGVLIGLFIYVRYIRSRIEGFKDKAHNVLKDSATISSNFSRKKKAKINKNSLDPDVYFRRHRVELTLESGHEIQLESIILSQYGVFVVLPQKQRGAIIGNATSTEWKEQTGDEIISFNNPLPMANQCCHFINQITDVAIEIEPIISFSDMSVFKSQLPITVMHQKQVNKYILGFKELKYSDTQVEQWLVKLDEFITQYREDKKAKAEQLVEKNRQRNTDENESHEPSPAEQAEQELLEQQQTTDYPEPGSYETPIDQSITEIESKEECDNKITQPMHEESFADPLSELDEILNRAKKFTDELDDINHFAEQSTQLGLTPDTPVGAEFNTELTEKCDETPSLTIDDESLEHTLLEQLTVEVSPTDGKDIIPDEVEINHDEAPYPENMISHSEFKRRAAKKAVDNGMFDYLEHYTDNSGQSHASNELDLEQEIKQSLEAGKGFLSELVNTTNKKYISPNNDDKESNLSEKPALTEVSNDVYDNKEQSPSELSESAMAHLEAVEIGAKSKGGNTQSPTSKYEENTHSDPQPLSENERGWRALKQEIEKQSSVDENTDNSATKEKKSSPFANLELDPEWAPKPPPKKVYNIKPEDDPDNN